MKTCKACGHEKPLSDFYPNSAAGDKHDVCCKECKKQRRREWYKKNKKHADAVSRAYRQKRTQIEPRYNADACRRYAQRHPERLKASRDKWARAHRAQRLEYMRAYQQQRRKEQKRT